MLAIARERAKENGLANIIEFHEADAESLHLPPSSIDAIVCRFGLMFMPSSWYFESNESCPCPGGRIAAAVWSAPDKVPSFVVPLQIVMKEMATPPPPPESPGPFSLADTKLLRQKFEQAGFHDINIEAILSDFKLPSPKEFVDFVRSTAGSLGAMMAGLPAARQDEICNKVADAVRKHADPRIGTVSFTNDVILVSAKR
ncbi:putative methyltransferase type 11 [Candidatus Nitrososphaera gargensis Ga9.2]|uniref:Putative methyltransferase type 11 n=1 Tax=Nitrososphaera gargensis (strain Ga9.2) TaxID=1237085 RepID=K0IFW6_NITGG|nr:putative methyltransferase type 11 [Candidatus Nitrososphaera gargensis Ga9.2]